MTGLQMSIARLTKFKRMLRDQKQAKNLLLFVVFVYTIVFLWHVFEDVYVTSIHRFYLVDGVDCTYEVGTIGIISVFQVRKNPPKIQHTY